MTDADHDGELSIELEGPASLSPSNFDVLSGLGSVHAYLELLSAIARQRKEILRFRGLRLEAGSVAFRVEVDQPVIARAVADEASELVEGRRLVPKGLGGRVRAVREVLGSVPTGVVARVRVGKFTKPLAPPTPEQLGPRFEATELRVRVYRVGGKPPKLSAESEVDGGFTLAVGEALATEIAKHLYREVDLVAEVNRDDEGHIVGGTALDFHPLDPGEASDEATIWREWFASAGRDWDEVEDIEHELDRSRETMIRG